jgi:copper(I)-binding protein
MINRRQVVTSALLAAAAGVVGIPSANARNYIKGPLMIGNPWSPPTKAGATSAQVFMVLENRGLESEKLRGVTSPVARAAAFVDEDGGVTEQVSFIDVRPRRPVQMRPGRIHVRLDGLQQQLVQGRTFQMTMNFEVAGPVEVTVEIDDR